MIVASHFSPASIQQRFQSCGIFTLALVPRWVDVIGSRMMKHKSAILLAGLMTCLTVSFSYAQESSPATATNVVPRMVTPQIRQLGDAAPPLTVLGWAKGNPVKIQPGTNTYVLVFCDLTRANDFALTNLSDLQKQYRDKGVIVVAISDEFPKLVKDFVLLKTNEIDFTVAVDDGASRTGRAYRQAFGQMQSTLAYIVSHDGKVLWYGHPLTDGMGQVVDDIVSGRYSLEQAKRKVVATEEMAQYLMLARTGDTNSIKAGRVLLAIRANNAAELCDLASQIAMDPYVQDRDVPLANEALDRAEQLGATNTTDIAVVRAILLFQSGKPEEGLDRAKQALSSAHTDVEQNEVKACIHVMEVRMAAAKTSHISTPPSSP